MKNWSLLVTIASFGVGVIADSAFGAGPSHGPDVIVGEIAGFSGTKGTAPTPISNLLVTTISCNAGDVSVNWQRLPDAHHPVITWNLYKLADGVLTQVGQSGVKHAFYAEQESGVCPWKCDAEPVLGGGKRLGPGCADPYGGALMLAPQYSGGRGAINPSTGAIDTLHATSPGPWALAAFDQDLGTSGARYFVEAQYIAADDSAALNGLNNVSFQEVTIGTDVHNPTLWHIPAVGKTHRGCPALLAWDGASVTASDGLGDGRVLIGLETRKVADGRYRVDVAVYNMNSDLGVRAISVPTSGFTVDASKVGFIAHFPVLEAGSHDAWKSELAPGAVTWSTVSATENPTTNAIRWGQMFNVWFEATAGTPPTIPQISITPFKGGGGAKLIPLTGGLKCDVNAYR
jgi:hypothetical protein